MSHYCWSCVQNVNFFHSFCQVDVLKKSKSSQLTRANCLFNQPKITECMHKRIIPVQKLESKIHWPVVVKGVKSLPVSRRQLQFGSH